jgi:hypothetical protein
MNRPVGLDPGPRPPRPHYVVKTQHSTAICSRAATLTQDPLTSFLSSLAVEALSYLWPRSFVCHHLVSRWIGLSVRAPIPSPTSGEEQWQRLLLIGPHTI